MLLIDIKAVSIPENKAEKRIKITKIIIWVVDIFLINFFYNKKRRMLFKFS